MDTYLCTRNQPYTNPNCLGHTDLKARQGYYVTAESLCDALALMQEHFPEDAEKVNHHRAETNPLMGLPPTNQGRGFL